MPAMLYIDRSKKHRGHGPLLQRQTTDHPKLYRARNQVS